MAMDHCKLSRSLWYSSSNGNIYLMHESPMRGETFVTQKIATAVAKIKVGKQDILS